MIFCISTFSSSPTVKEQVPIVDWKCFWECLLSHNSYCWKQYALWWHPSTCCCPRPLASHCRRNCSKLGKFTIIVISVVGLCYRSHLWLSWMLFQAVPHYLNFWPLLRFKCFSWLARSKGMSTIRFRRSTFTINYSLSKNKYQIYLLELE